MKRLILVTCIMSLLCLASKAQTALDSKINKLKGSVTSAGASASGTVSSIDSGKKQAAALTNQVGSMLGIKKKPSTVAIINVPGAKRSQLKAIVEGLRSIKGVDKDETQIAQCDDKAQTITVKCKGTIGDVLDAVLKNDPKLFKPDFTQSPDGTVTLSL